MEDGCVCSLSTAVKPERLMNAAPFLSSVLYVNLLLLPACCGLVLLALAPFSSQLLCELCTSGIRGNEDGKEASDMKDGDGGRRGEA